MDSNTPPLAKLIALLCLLHAPLLLLQGCARTDNEQTGAFATQALSGPWAFYWKVLLSPADLATGKPEPDARVRLPGSWTALTVHGQRLPPAGYATYHLVVDLPADRPDRLAIFIPHAYSAFRFYVNGVLRSTLGKVSQGAAQAEGDYGRRTILIDHPPRRLDLVAQVSNFSSRVAGFGRPLLLGTPTAIATEQLRMATTDAVLAGGFLLIGVSQLIIFFLRRNELPYLLFGLTIILWSCRVIIAGQLLPIFGWHLPLAPARTLDGSLALASALTYVLFLSTLFPRELPMRWARWSLALLVGYLPFPLFFSSLTRSEAFHWFLIGGAVLLAVAFVGVVRAAFRRREDAGLVLASAGLIAVTTGIQLYLFDELGIKEPVASIGVLIAVSMQSVALARRYSRALTRSQRLEGALRRANRLKDEFLANTSHELRTPLHGMIGLAESLQERHPELPADGLPLIVSSGRRLVRLIDDILDFTRLRHDDLHFETKPTPVAPIAHAVLATCQPLVAGRNIELRAEIPGDLPPVEADPDRLHQILFNLVGNAIKFTESGSVSVRACRDDDKVLVDVEDTGIGIAPEEWRRLVLPYEQASESSNEGRGGVGLGLAISRQLLAMHGSELSFSARADGGTRVGFSLPVCDRRSLPSTPFEDPVEGDTESNPLQSAAVSAADGPRILIVDDERTGRLLLERQLAFKGYRIECASSGEEALKRVEVNRPALVILDVMMPDMSGLTVCRLLREEYDANTLPIILLTARTRPEDTVDGLNAGANDYLAKPFYRVELLARVEAQLRVRENEQMRWALSEGRHQDEDPRSLLVELLSTSIQYWEMATGLPRADLAEQSGLWAVTLDESTRKTRTLDRYLSIETLPKRPRWRVVARTALFVMDRTENSVHKRRLNELLERLERTLESG